METDVDEDLRGLQTERSDIKATKVEEDVNCDKVISSPACLEGKDLAR